MGGMLIMFKHKNIQEQIVDERNKNEAMLSQILEILADMEYIAMMTDVDLEEGDDEDEQEV
jgi:hypothetical protein